MKKYIFSIARYFQKHPDFVLFIITLFISIGAFIYFFQNGQMHLANYDAVARMNTARKVIDSITPGVGQLGGIWLPFPHILMLPFVWNDYLWHSGLAGYFISGPAFIFGALLVKKISFLLTDNLKVSLLIWFLFVSNINTLLLQTMAMSESFFTFSLIAATYYLISWIKNHDIIHFLLTAFFVMLLTLTRYEGYFVLFAVSLVVFFESIRSFRKDGREKIEGMMLLFLTVAGFGIILWSIYSALFYKDPLFWLNIYSTTSTSIIQGENLPVDDVYGNLNPTLIESVGIYLSIVFRTIGAITVSLGLLGLFMYIRDLIARKIERQKIILFAPIGVVSLVLLFFLVVGYYIGFIPHIEFPPVYLTGSKIREWSIYADSNIRYGMVLFPMVLFFTAYAASKNKLFFYLILALVSAQSYMTIVRPDVLQFTFVSSWQYPVNTDALWLSSNYDEGLILISSARHENYMFQTKLPYKKFIYEGTRNYWSESLEDPSKHADWVVYDDTITGDGVAYNMTKEGYDILLEKFQLVYENKGLKIHKRIKT